MENYYIASLITRIPPLKLSRSFLLIGVFYGCTLFGQNYTKQCKLADELFPDDDKVILYKNYHLSIEPVGDTIQFVSTNRKVDYIRKNSQIHSKESIYYSSEFASISNLEAFTINLASSKKTKFAGAAEGMYFSSNIFYDDNRETYFIYPNMEDNVVTEMEYKMNYFEPRLIPSYYFSFNEPVLHSSMTVTFPLDCEIGWLIRDQGKYKIEMTKTVVKNKNEYTWKLENASILGSLTGDVSASKILPHVIVWIKKYKTKKRETRVLGDIDDLYAWYNGFLNHAKTKDQDLVKTVSDSISKNATSGLEKAKGIFKWVQDNISYVAVEDGYSGFIPRRADEVIKKKYGDCKDMANLLVELMKNCGLDARHVWIGTRDIPYTYYDVYTPIVDNHMIAAVKMDNVFYFLDATGKFMPFGFPTSMIQGKVALVEENDKHFELKKVEVIASDSNSMKDSVQLYISGDKLNGTGTYHLSGYPMIESKIQLSYAENNSEQKYFKELLLKGNNKFKLLNYELDDVVRVNDPMAISYTFEMDNYISSNTNEIFVNMNIGKTGLSPLVAQEINGEAFSTNDYNYIKDDYFSLTIPSGYTVDFTPADNLIEHDFLSYSSTYSIKGNKLVLHRRLVVNYLELSGDQLSKFNATVASIQKIERSNILLINKK
jgi:hypothetical protein